MRNIYPHGMYFTSVWNFGVYLQWRDNWGKGGWKQLLLCRIKYLNKYIRKRAFYLYLQRNFFFLSKIAEDTDIYMCDAPGWCWKVAWGKRRGFSHSAPFQGETSSSSCCLVWPSHAFSVENAIRYDVLKKDFDQWKYRGRAWLEALISSRKSQIGRTKPRQTKMCVICSKN